MLVAGAPRAASADCAWGVKATKQTLNIAFPDTASTYWSYRYNLAEGEALVVQGKAIAGRYFSLNTYNFRGVNLDGVADVDLGYGPGVTDAPPTWSVTIRPGAIAGAEPGVMAATATGETSGRGVLIYRVYVPDDPRDPQAGAPLPTITLRDGADEEVLPACENPGGSWLVRLFVRLFGPKPNEEPHDPPIFIRPVSAEGFFPNRDNKYLAALTTWTPGRVAVVQGKAPRVPQDVRYWSFCSNEYRMPYPVEACLYDAQVTTSTEGVYTFVVSTPGDRPANATREAGVNWLPWSDTDEINLLLLRNMLPDPGFAQAVQRVTPGDRGDDVMGPYAPQVKYCTRASFEADGAACAP